MDIVPDTAGATLATQLSTVIADNILGILGVMFLTASVAFTVRWFRKAAKVRG